MLDSVFDEDLSYVHRQEEKHLVIEIDKLDQLYLQLNQLPTFGRFRKLF